jgi:hypothetical protein
MRKQPTLSRSLHRVDVIPATFCIIEVAEIAMDHPV